MGVSRFMQVIMQMFMTGFMLVLVNMAVPLAMLIWGAGASMGFPLAISAAADDRTRGEPDSERRDRTEGAQPEPPHVVASPVEQQAKR